MKLFIKSNTHIKRIFRCMLVVIDVLIIFLGFTTNNIYKSMMLMAFFIAIYMLYILLFWKEGLHINDDTLYYKGIIKKVYNIDDIARLHIVEAQINLGYNRISNTYSNISLKDFKGNYCYNILYLKTKNIKMHRSDYGDFDFYINHKDSILFSTEYDKRVIDFFESRGVLITGHIK